MKTGGSAKWSKERWTAYMRDWRSKNRQHHNAACRAYRKKNRDRLNQRLRDDRAALRRQVLKRYSDGRPQCSCCGTEYYPFLTLDHINKDGANHRETVTGNRRSTGRRFWAWIIKNGFPPGFRVLCYNCNCSAAYHSDINQCGCPFGPDKQMAEDHKDPRPSN